MQILDLRVVQIDKELDHGIFRKMKFAALSLSPMDRVDFIELKPAVNKINKRRYFTYCSYFLLVVNR